MDEIEKMKEASMRIVEEYLELLKPFVQQIDRLNTRIKELEVQHDCLLKDKKVLNDLFCSKCARIKQLEDERDGFRNGQLQLQNMVNDLMDVNAKWTKKVRELGGGIKKVLEWRSRHNERIPFWEELYNLIEKGGEDGR